MIFPAVEPADSSLHEITAARRPAFGFVLAAALPAGSLRRAQHAGEGYHRNAYDYEAVKRLLLDPCRSSRATTGALCGIDPLAQRDHSSEVTPLGADSVLIVDGVFAFRPEINAYWDFRVWLRVDAELSVRRSAERDQDWAGAEADTLRRTRYPAAERVYLREVDPLPMMDVVIDNSVFARPRVVTP
ncbi:uridine kinase [Streptomyces sp. Edi4]|uniref:uridine kinase n=1 Tax=Streptomyces sp. Edi4 TaxID=3162527 RepID=UPI00330683F1